MTRLPPLADAIGVHLLRFAVMFVALEIAIVAGVEGFALGLVANTAVTVLAVALMTWRGLWRSSGPMRTPSPKSVECPPGTEV